VAPVLALVHAFGVGFGEGRFMLESCDGKGKLSHWVEVTGAAVDELLDERRDVRTGGPFCRKVPDLLLAGNFAAQEKPKKTSYSQYRISE